MITTRTSTPTPTPSLPRALPAEDRQRLMRVAREVAFTQGERLFGHLGAEATTPVRAYEFDATAVRQMCQEEPAMGRAVGLWVGEVLAHRPQNARTRLLNLNVPCGSGSIG